MARFMVERWAGNLAISLPQRVSRMSSCFKVLVHQLLMLVGSYQECAGTTGRVKDLVIFLFQAEAENQVNHIRVGEILSQIVAFVLGMSFSKIPPIIS